MAATSKKDAILQSASQLFYNRGIRAVGVEDILEDSGVTRVTFYRAFSGKSVLVRSYLAVRREQAVAELRARIEGRDDPIEAILELFLGMNDLAAIGKFKGCAFMMARMEFRDDKEILEISEGYKSDVVEIFRQALARSGDDNASKAEELAMIYEGALAMFVTYPKLEIGTIAHRAAQKLLL